MMICIYSPPNTKSEGKHVNSAAYKLILLPLRMITWSIYVYSRFYRKISISYLYICYTIFAAQMCFKEP